jgi:hypothetical protein
MRSLSERLEMVEEQLDSIARDVRAMRRQQAGDVEVGAEQARLEVDQD